MRIKLDENLPASTLVVALELGHDADTVIGEGLAGASDIDVLAAAHLDGRLLITLDRGFGDIRTHALGTHSGLVVLRVVSQDPDAMEEAVRSFLSTTDLGDLSGCTVVVRGGSMRIRRPE